MAKARKKAGGGDVALGIDLGGTKILAGVVGGPSEVLGRGKTKTPFAGTGEDLTKALLEAIDQALAAAGKTRHDVGAVGVAAPGPLDSSRGVLLRANNLAVENFSVIDALGPHFPGVSEVKLENDVRLAAYGEAHLGAGKGVRSMVAMWVGTGLGGAVLFDGKLWTGRNRNAGEIGQINVDIRRAKPGLSDGTLENVAAKVGMTRWLREKIEDGGKTSLKKVVARKDVRLKTSDLVAALREGDALAERAVARSAKAVGLAIANIFNVLSPDLFVLGGGIVVDLGASYVEEVTEWARKFAFTQELGDVQIAVAALGDDAGILGAALFARE